MHSLYCKRLGHWRPSCEKRSRGSFLIFERFVSKAPAFLPLGGGGGQEAADLVPCPAGLPPPPLHPGGSQGPGVRGMRLGTLVPHLGGPHPSGPRARAGPPGAKLPLFSLLPETRGSGLPGPPCLWGVSVCGACECV